MSAITTQGSTKERKQIILVSITGILLSLIVTSLILGIPYYKDTKNNVINNLQLMTDNKAIMLSHQLYRYRSQAYSISQRIHATRLLAKFYRNGISLEEFRHDSGKILKEAMSQTEDIIGLVRLSNQQMPLLELGKTIPDSYWRPLVAPEPGYNDAHVIHINDDSILLLISTITNHLGKTIGTDIVVINPEKLSLIIKPQEQDRLPVNGIIFSLRNGNIDPVIPPPGNKTDKDIDIISSTILQDKKDNHIATSEIGQQVVTHAQVANSPWIVTISTNRQYLYKDIKQKIILVGAELFIISLLSALLMLKIMKPLARRVVQHSEQKLQKTEERFRSLVEKTNDWIWETDDKGQYTYSSPSIKNILGYSNEEIIGHLPFEFMTDDESKRIGKIFNELSSKHLPIHNLENENLHKDGHTVILETSAVPYFADNGEYRGYRGVDRDITSRKAIEKELVQHRNNLERQVQKRTAELVDLYQELEAFSYTASHDLRTPLRAIDGFTTALQEEYSDQLDDTGNDYLTRVRLAANKMSELIDALLQLTKITRHEINLDRTSLSALVKSSIEQYIEIDKNRNIEFKISPDLYCQCDRKLMLIVMDNLIGNAWKYTSTQDNPTIEFGSTFEQGETVYFVRDNGVGLDTRYADKIFQPFQRLHTDREFKGTGIGLATVQRIIQKHGGKIWVASSLGQGATFYFTLGQNKLQMASG